MPPSAPNNSPRDQISPRRTEDEQNSKESPAKGTRSGILTTDGVGTAGTAVNSSRNELLQPIPNTMQTAGTTDSSMPWNSLNNTMNNLSPYGNTSGGMYGGGMQYGGGMYGSGGMYGYGGGYGTMGYSPYNMGPLSGLNQFLFGVQNVIFSLGQAVQIIGMNTEAVKHLLESATAMFDHAVATWQEMQTLEAAARNCESEDAKKRRRRLRALRWAMVAAVTYAGYMIVRRIIAACRRRRPAIQGVSQSTNRPSHSGTSYPYEGTTYPRPGSSTPTSARYGYHY